MNTLHEQWLSQAFTSSLWSAVAPDLTVLMSHIIYTLWHVEGTYIVAADPAKRRGTCACFLLPVSQGSSKIVGM